MFLKTPQEMALEAASRFRELRISKKITLRNLSEDSGVPYSTIRRFESKGEISFVALVKLASVLGEDEQIDTLFSRKTPNSIEEVLRENRRKA